MSEGTPIRVRTAKRLAYASGYLELGLLTEAGDEIEAIDFADRLEPEVLLLRLELALAARHFELLADMAAVVTGRKPGAERAWILRAVACKALGRVPEAKATLLEAEAKHGHKSAVLHFNLGCYHSLLGELAEARDRVALACKLAPELRPEALADPDLAALWDSWSLPGEAG